jgi:hypothetical protein
MSAIRKNPQLWTRIKNQVMNESIGGTESGYWSARKAQIAVKRYKDAGGLYVGKKSPYNSLTKWSKQQWRTKSGSPSSLTGERYLPTQAIKALSPQKYRQTSLKKKRDEEKGLHYSKQPNDIANITKKYRS